VYVYYVCIVYYVCVYVTLPSYLLTFSRDSFKIESTSSHESTYSSNTELDCTFAHLVSHINNAASD
jgi:hypothetical protein